MTDEHFIKKQYDYVSLQLAGHCDAAEFSVFWAYESSDEPGTASVYYLDSSEMEWKATDMDFTTCLHVGISTGFNWYWLANFDFTCHNFDSYLDEDEAIVYEDEDEEFTDKIPYLARIRLIQAGLVPIARLQLPAEYRARLLTIADESGAARDCLIETGMAPDAADEFITEWRACVDTLSRRQFQLEAE